MTIELKDGIDEFKFQLAEWKRKNSADLDKAGGFSKSDDRASAWVFTFNNPLKCEDSYLSDLFAMVRGHTVKKTNRAYWLMEQKGLAHLEFGEEWGSGSGTHHYQGFAVFEYPVPFSHLKKYFSALHVQKMKGLLKQNIAYVGKDGRVSKKTRPGWDEIDILNMVRQSNGAKSGKFSTSEYRKLVNFLEDNHQDVLFEYFKNYKELKNFEKIE